MRLRSGAVQRALQGLLLTGALAACSGPGPEGAAADASVRAAPSSDGQLTSVQGEVTLERKGATARAAPGPLFLGDALQTGPDGEAVVTLKVGRAIEVGPDARLVLTRDAQGLVLNVERGLILSRVPQDAAETGPQVTLSILTPFGLTRLGKSEVAVDVGADSAKVDVKVGSIEMVSRNGQAVTVAAGEATVLSRTGATPWVMPAVPIAITSVAGRAELKKKDQARWLAVSPQKPTALEPGDALRVKDGRAAIEGGGGRLSATKGSELTVVESAAGRTVVTLAKGTLSASFAAGRKSVLGLGDVSLVSERGGQLEVEKTPKGYQLSALTGDVTVQREGSEPQRVEGGHAATVTGAGVSVSEVGKELLVLPSRPGLKVFHPGVARATLTWDGEEGKRYRVEVASDPSFTTPILAGEVHQRFLNVPIPVRGNLHWRVFDGETPVDQGSAYFAPEPRAGGDLDRNKNEVKDGADKTTIYFQDKPPVVTFAWAEEEGASRYQVQVYREGELKKAVAERTAKELKVALPEGALNEGKYLWSVTPQDAKGQELRGGKMNKLEITYDNAVPNLLLKSPLNGDAVGAKAHVVGIAPVGAKVFCNGKALPLDDKARFDAEIAPLSGGRLVFRMLKGGAEVYTVRRVR